MDDELPALEFFHIYGAIDKRRGYPVMATRVTPVKCPRLVKHFHDLGAELLYSRNSFGTMMYDGLRLRDGQQVNVGDWVIQLEYSNVYILSNEDFTSRWIV